MSDSTWTDTAEAKSNSRWVDTDEAKGNSEWLSDFETYAMALADGSSLWR